MNLKELVKKDTATLTADVEFRHGLVITLRYVSRAEAGRISRESLVMRYDEKLKTRSPQLDGKKFAEAFCEAAVVGWKGATVATLAKLMPIEIGSLSKEQLAAEVPFTQENMATLLEHTYELDGFLQEQSLDINTFNSAKGDEEKNSQASPSGN